ncbi:polyphosphate polymerase domain-containing protein [Actinotalea sp. M2MS4P-6]|uniref:polyphosphate polymerase domain-containing protein n=1 Tax=Actinotalea sp. M2MS4P-6 TaxID=2983762 RepID=UPI0021E3621C|nr:polyphosphate polymerase domain-containing protein [Actinotalea sp. M2MS4P-6]MCV2394944.1 polyphosphate polymerase domain-containing protein [Actinotalea sp. M2MS4P-6]
MSTATVPAAEALAPIDLAEIEQVAHLQTRVDRKYLVPLELADQLVGEAVPHGRVLTIDGRTGFGYESVYFDTDDLAAYRAAAGRRRHRFKVRTRTYLDSGHSVLEVKTRGSRGETVKERITHDAETTTLDRAGIAFIEERIGDLVGDRELVPTLTTRYRRTTVVDAAVPMRMTIDTDLRCGDGADEVGLDGMAIVEVKSGARATPADRWLWAHGVRPLAISKYAVGVAALRGLPGNRWRRPLSLVG